MRNTWLLTIAVLPACITTDDPRRVEATWTIVRLDGTAASCPPSWRTTRLVMADTLHPDVRIVDRFTCTAGEGESSHLPADSYVSWLEFLDADDQIVATSFQTTVDVKPFAPAIASKIYVDAGFVALSWSFANPAGSCSVGWDPFLDIALSLSGPTSVTNLFSCHDTNGITAPLPPGDYHAWLGQGVQGHDIPDIVIEAPNRVTDLGHVTF